MARYHSSSYSRQRGRRRRGIHIILALPIIIAVVNVFVRGPNTFDESEDKFSAFLTVTKAENETAPAALKPVPGPKPNLLEIPAPTSESDPKSTALIAEAVKFINTTPAKVIKARDMLNEVLATPISGQQQEFVKNRLSELADKWLFSKTIFSQDNLCSSYKVKPGDQLGRIGRRFKVPYEILMEINKIPYAETLQAGETIKIINGPFHARVYRSTFTMDLYLQDTFVRSFSVGLGQPGMETPTGLWLVKPDGKLMKPAWTDPAYGKTYEAEDPDYPLGSIWIGLEGIKGDAKGRAGFAIHGTREPNQIGTASSQGCIRLHNGDAILIYNLLMSGFSRVEIVE